MRQPETQSERKYPAAVFIEMSSKNPEVDPYFVNGCGRCPLGGTPECKVHSWPKELKRLRTIALDCGLQEQLKWSVPCYTHDHRNIVIVSALKECCTLGFFKGALLKDPAGILDKPGENTQSARLVRFRSVKEINDLERTIREYILEAIQLEKTGAKFEFNAKHELLIPDELYRKFQALPALQAAFDSLTQGRQRGYILYFNGAKQSKTKASRIEKCVPQILEGRGLHD